MKYDIGYADLDNLLNKSISLEELNEKVEELNDKISFGMNTKKRNKHFNKRS